MVPGRPGWALNRKKARIIAGLFLWGRLWPRFWNHLFAGYGRH